MFLSLASSALKRTWQALLRYGRIFEWWGDAFERFGKSGTTLDDLITDVTPRRLGGNPAPVGTVGTAKRRRTPTPERRGPGSRRSEDLMARRA